VKVHCMIVSCYIFRAMLVRLLYLKPSVHSIFFQPLSGLFTALFRRGNCVADYQRLAGRLPHRPTSQLLIVRRAISVSEKRRGQWALFSMHMLHSALKSSHTPLKNKVDFECGEQ